MKRYITFIMSVLMVAMNLFFSCTAPFEFASQYSEPMIVIYGCLTDEDKNQYIRITRSSPYFQEEENQIVSDAKVTVRSSEGKHYSFEHDSAGFYVCQQSITVTPGVTFRLSVEVDFDKDGNIDLYEAEARTPSKTLVDTITVTSLSILGKHQYALNIYMQEPSGMENFYLFNFVINDSITNDMISDYIILSDQYFNGKYVNGLSIKYFDATSDKENTDNLSNVFTIRRGDRIKLKSMGIEKGYYYFISDCTTEKSGENPFFGGPPSNVITNLSKGAIGYFTSFCVLENETIVQ